MPSDDFVGPSVSAADEAGDLGEQDRLGEEGEGARLLIAFLLCELREIDAAAVTEAAHGKLDLIVIRATKEELAAHHAQLADIDKASGGKLNFDLTLEQVEQQLEHALGRRRSS